MTRKVLDLSLSFFLVACGICFLVGIFSIKPILNSSQIMFEEGRNLLADTRTHLKESKELQNDIIKSSNDVKDVAFELGISALTIAMAEQKIISPTDADRIVLKSLDEIEKRSDRLGELAKYFNDFRLMQQGR
jgi:hypothetical protein